MKFVASRDDYNSDSGVDNAPISAIDIFLMSIDRASLLSTPSGP
jgi:hypothetical protein